MAGTSNSICQTWAPAHAYPFASVPAVDVPQGARGKKSIIFYLLSGEMEIQNTARER